MRFSKRTLSIATVALVLAALGLGIWWRVRPAEAEGTPGRDADTTGVSVESVGEQFSTSIPQPVEGAEVVRDTLWVSVTAAGEAAPYREAVLSAEVPGVVRAVRVRENSRVGQGQALVQLDTTELALDVAEAEAALREARAEFERLTLFDDRVEDEAVRRRRAEVARARSGLDAAEVRLRRARFDLARSTIRAPFSGRVANLRVVPGERVDPGTEILTVVDLDPIKVEVQVLEAELGTLEEGRRATVAFPAFTGQRLEGRIASINPVVEPETRTGRVTVLLDNPTGLIRPGMYARVQLEAQAFPDRVLVPREAVLERGEGRRRTMLFVYEPREGEDHGRAMWRYVTTGRENERLVEIVPSDEGIVEPGEVVLVDGHHYLAHGVDVRLVENVAVEGGRPGGR